MRPLLALLFTLAACGGSPAASRPQTAPAATAPTAAAPTELAPQLFTVEQLRDGIPQGRVIELRMEVAGKPATIENWEFTKVDADTATIHAITRDESGAVLADETGTSTWQDLHRHGQFPAAATTIEDDVTITVPAGTFVTRLYTVTEGDAIRRFWFAVDLPGPPVQFTTEHAGKQVMRAQMLRAR